MSYFTNIIPIVGDQRPRERIIDNLVVGDGKSISMRVNREGLALGGKTWGEAPFRVDMAGNASMRSAYIENAVAYNLTITGNDPSRQYIRAGAVLDGKLGLYLPNGEFYAVQIF